LQLICFKNTYGYGNGYDYEVLLLLFRSYAFFFVALRELLFSS